MPAPDQYLDQIFAVERGTYGELGALLIIVATFGFLIPLTAIALFGRCV